LISSHIQNPRLSDIASAFEKKPFSIEEDDIIFAKVSTIGRHWEKIAETLPDRSPVEIKNRFEKLQQEKRNQMFLKG
jgi:hypothetical protein